MLAVGVQARRVLLEQLVDPGGALVGIGARPQLAQRRQERRHAGEAQLAVDDLGQLARRPRVVLAPALGEGAVEQLLPAGVEAGAEARRQFVGVEALVPGLEHRLGGELGHPAAVLADRRGDDPAPALASQPELPRGDLDARRHPLDVPLPRPRQRLVEVVGTEDQPPVGRREAAEVVDVGVAADLDHEARVRRRGEVGRHHRGGAAVEGEGRGGHPPVADRQQLGDPRLGLAAEDRDRVLAVGGGRPVGVRGARRRRSRGAAPLGVLPVFQSRDRRHRRNLTLRGPTQ